MEALHMKLHRVRITWYLAVNVYTSLSKKKKKEREKLKMSLLGAQLMEL